MKRAKTGNKADILEAVWMHEGISRIDLAKSLGIDKSTVSNIVGDLIDRDLLEEYDQALASSLGGRKPVKLRLHKGFGSVVGVEVQPDFYRLVVIDLSGQKVFSWSEAVPTEGSGIEERVLGILDTLRAKAPVHYERCLGLGLAVSGIVNPMSGIVIRSVSLGLQQVPLMARLAGRLPFPVFIENDANAACWGEVVLQRNLHQPSRSFLFCLVEFHEKRTGRTEIGGSVGLGFVINGQIHYGDDFAAGEFRSLGWKPDRTFQFGLDDDTMARLRRDGKVQEAFLRELLGHLLFLSKAINLNSLYFGGDMDILQEKLTAVMEEEALQAWNKDSRCQMRFSTQGNDAVAYGAACLGLTRFFRDSESARVAGLPAFR